MQVPHLIVVKEGQVIDNVLLVGRDTFIVGRHQNSDIVAGHASVSRHHLQIQVDYETKRLILKDLQSVHGTLINGTLLQPLCASTMNDDDTFQLGASTRTYMVKWLPVADQQEASVSSPASAPPAPPDIKVFEEQFQSALRLDDQENHTSLTPCDSQAKTKPEKQHPDSARRLAFADLNGRSPLSTSRPLGSPRNSPACKKSPASRRMGSPCNSPNAKTALRMSPAGKKIFGERSALHILQESYADQTPSKLWLRRCSSQPLPLIDTVQPSQQHQLPASKDESADDYLSKLSSNLDEADEYASDKENVAPDGCRWLQNSVQKSEKSSSDRQPFQQLFYLPSPGACTSHYKPVFEPAPYDTSDDNDSLKGLGLPKYNRRPPLVSNRQIKDSRKQWHIVVDTNCFLDYESFRSLKQLEGIRETRLIIPKIVIRELDAMKRTRAESRGALRWIQECMVKLDWWVHVQNSFETRPVEVTPKAIDWFTAVDNIMSPTNDDHVLDCALLFDKSVLDGRVALVTNDIALRIKAMAEGLVSECASSFCASLLSPYSDKFLWAGSTAHNRSCVTSPLCRTSNRISHCSYSSSSNSQCTSNSNTTSTSNSNSNRSNKFGESRRKEEARGLQLVLQCEG